MAKLHTGVKSFDDVRKTLQQISMLLTAVEGQAGEAGSVNNAYAKVTDGSTTASASGEDTFKIRSSDGSVNVTVSNDQSQHGDNVDLVANIDDNAANGVINHAISSNWAYDHDNDDDVHDASAVNLLEVGTATYDDLQDFVNTLFSAGRISGGEITDAGSGQVDIAAGTGMIKISDTEITEVRFCDWSTVSGQALTDNSTNHIYVRYNGGNPDVQVTTNESTISGHDEFEIGQVYRSGTDVHIAVHGPDLVDHLFHITERFHDTGHVRASGLMISHTGTRNIAMTAGAFWVELCYVAINALDTSASDTFTSHYHSSGSWTSAATQTQINNTQYDDGSDLATLTANRYGVHWVYLHEEGDLHIVYGRGDYKLSQSVGSTVPAGLPDIITEMGTLIGRIIIQKNAASFAEVATAFETTFGSTGVADHVELANLQGGTAGEYYHLTAAEEAELTAWLASVVLAANGDMTAADVTVDNLITAGDVDGRDVSVDGTKLDGIEAGADVTGDNAPQAHAASHEDTGSDEISIAGLSGLLADNQNPTAHASEHTDGTDDIQDATDAQKGLATAAQITKLDGIAAGADVTGTNAPQAHHDSHDPNDGSDALDTANAASIASVQAAGTGTSHSFARADHVHGIAHSIADNALVTVDHAAAADDDYAKFTANGLEGRSYAEVRSDLNIADGSTVDQNLWETIDSDGASVAANTTTDTLTIAGGSGLTTSVAGDTLTVAGDDAVANGATKGVATFTAADFDDAAGVISLASDVLRDADFGIADDDVVQIDDADAADDDYAKFTASGLEGRSYAEVTSDLDLEIGTDVLAEQTIGIADDNLLEVDDADVADDDYAKFTANGLEGRSYAEVKADLDLEIGTDVLAEQTIGIADDNLLEVDDADATDNDYAKFTANGLEGRDYGEVLSDIGAVDITGDTMTGDLAILGVGISRSLVLQRAVDDGGPAAVVDGSVLGRALFEGYDGDSYEEGGWLRYEANETWTDAHRGCAADITVTLAGALTLLRLVLEAASATDMKLSAGGDGADIDLSLASKGTGDINVTPADTGDVVLDGLKWPKVDGDANHHLKTDGAGQLGWTAAGSGDVVGPGSATDHRLVRWDGASGKLVQDSNAYLDDGDNLLLPADSLMALRDVNTYIQSPSSGTLIVMASGGTIRLISSHVTFLCNAIQGSHALDVIVLGSVASAVNELTLTNAVTTASPEISATGDDTNLNLLLAAKGTGVVKADGVEVVTLTGTQTLTNKTLTTPAIADLQNMTHDHGSAAKGDNLAAKYRTDSANYHEQPVLAVRTVVIKYFKYAATITHVKHVTAADTATWMLEIREGSPHAGGSDVFAADEVSTTTPQTEDSFADATIPADSYVVFVPTSKTGTPEQLDVALVWTID